MPIIDTKPEPPPEKPKRRTPLEKAEEARIYAEKWRLRETAKLNLQTALANLRAKRMVVARDCAQSAIDNLIALEELEVKT